MKVLIIVSTILTAAAAGLIYPYQTSFGHYGQGYGDHYGHHEVAIGPHGVPHETPEVAAARAVHLAAHAEERARHTGYAYGHGVHTPQGPIDTPEVQIAKFKHLAAHAEAKHRSTNPHLSTPLETPEVQIARHEHLAAHANAHHQVQPMVPVDTTEVQQAKIAHFTAVAEAKAHQNKYDTNQQSYEQIYEEGTHHLGYGYGPDHQEHSVAPVDTVEVKKAKDAHFAAVAEAQADKHESFQQSYEPIYEEGTHHLGYGYGQDHQGHPVAPVDTVEIKKAKDAHFAVVAKAQADKHESYQQSYEPIYEENSHYLGYGYGQDHQGLPVAPVDTVEVKKAKDAHLAVVAKAQVEQDKHESYQQSYEPIYEESSHHFGYGYEQDHQGHPVAPVDTVEVKKAKDAHFAVVAKAQAEHGKHESYQQSYEPIYEENSHHLGYGYGQDHQGLPVAPVDTVEVKKAKDAHFAIVAKAQAEHDKHESYQQSYEPIYEEKSHHLGYGYGQDHQGHPVAPVDTVEVKQAKDAHFAVVAKAQAEHDKHESYQQSYEPIYEENSHHFGYGYEQDHQGHPVAPVDTVEVKQAKVAHFAAVAKAQALQAQHPDVYQHSYEPNYGHGYEHEYSDVVPAVYQHHEW